MQTGAIRVYPPSVEFHGVEAGTLYCIVICIQNASQISRRVRVIPPSNPAFRVKFNPSTAVAPGIDVRAEVEFLAETEVDHADVLTVVASFIDDLHVILLVSRDWRRAALCPCQG